MAGELGVGVLATTLFTPLDSLRVLFEHHAAGLERCRPAGSFVNQKRAVFTFMHCAETREEAIHSGAAEAALWFVNAAPRVFQVPRSVWIDAIRGDLQSSDPSFSASVDPAQVLTDTDLDDPHPLVRLLNRQLAGQDLDPVEVFETLEPIESVVIGDVDLCRRKLSAYAAIGVDRLMCLMAIGALPQREVMRSLRVTGEVLLPEMMALGEPAS
jgi:hypothetical protein